MLLDQTTLSDQSGGNMKNVLGVVTPAAGIQLCEASSITKFGRVLSATILTFSLIALTGCAGAPIGESEPVTAVEALTELMARAEGFAAVPGGREQARDAYRQAAKAYPTSKLPWSKLGESYFEAKDYGNAILAAQEVLEREPTDRAALGFLAVSGLRVSSHALFNLRSEGASANGSIRTEAEALAVTLRGVLGESVLFPQQAQVAKPVEVPVPAKPTRRVRRAAVRAVSSDTPAAGVAAVPAPSRSASANPFDRLK
jgi:hypothetical protein